MNLEIPVIGILRGVHADFFGLLMDAAFEAGTLENASAYLEAGAKAVGAGSSLFGKEAIVMKRQEDILANVRNFIKQICKPDQI